jgi:hypothetical protein
MKGGKLKAFLAIVGASIVALTMLTWELLLG